MSRNKTWRPDTEGLRRDPTEWFLPGRGHQDRSGFGHGPQECVVLHLADPLQVRGAVNWGCQTWCTRTVTDVDEPLFRQLRRHVGEQLPALLIGETTSEQELLATGVARICRNAIRFHANTGPGVQDRRELRDHRPADQDIGIGRIQLGRALLQSGVGSCARGGDARGLIAPVQDTGDSRRGRAAVLARSAIPPQIGRQAPQPVVPDVTDIRDTGLLKGPDRRSPQQGEQVLAVHHIRPEVPQCCGDPVPDVPVPRWSDDSSGVAQTTTRGQSVVVLYQLQYIVSAVPQAADFGFHGKTFSADLQVVVVQHQNPHHAAPSASSPRRHCPLSMS